MTGAAVHGQDRRMRWHHAIQRELGRLVAPIWVPLAVGILRFGLGYRVTQIRDIRRQFRQIRREYRGPLLICPNHLTMIDSYLVAWALAPTWRYVLRFDLLPWNTPESTNFGANALERLYYYFQKCIPITRGGSREEVSAVLKRVTHLLSRGEIALLFPEGGRSRTGRVEEGSGGWGVGRIVNALPGCRVLVVFLRGEAQDTWSDRPKRGDRLHVNLACIEPKSDHRGVRRTRDYSGQIVNELRRMEAEYFDGRQ